MLGVERGGLGEKRQSGERGVEEGERWGKAEGRRGRWGRRGKVGKKVRRGGGEMLKEVRTRGKVWKRVREKKGEVGKRGEKRRARWGKR